MVKLERPDDFDPKFIVAGCLFECGGEILILHRQGHKPQGNMWGIPAGKVEPNEITNISSTVIREVYEETGYKIPENILQKVQTFYVRYPDYDFEYHYFKIKLLQKPEIKINTNEHREYRWVTPLEALALPLIPDEDFCLKYTCGII